MTEQLPTSETNKVIALWSLHISVISRCLIAVGIQPFVSNEIINRTFIPSGQHETSNIFSTCSDIIFSVNMKVYFFTSFNNFSVINNLNNNEGCCGLPYRNLLILPCEKDHDGILTILFQLVLQHHDWDSRRTNLFYCYVYQDGTYSFKVHICES